MEEMNSADMTIPDDLKDCILFHGHLCPGLVYGYRVAKEAMTLLNITRSADEEIVAICENDSCAVDGLQALIGTTAGKGNLMIKDYGKNAYTVLNRSMRKGYRFSRTRHYQYDGESPDEFRRLDDAVSSGKASDQEMHRLKLLKAKDLLSKPFHELFSVQEVEYNEPPYALLARSVPCAKCGEMTMAAKTVEDANSGRICLPCSGAA